METFSALFEMDGVLSEIELAAEKARYQSGQVLDELNETLNGVTSRGYDDLRIMSDIVFDYVVEIDDKLKKVAELFREAFDQGRKTDERLKELEDQIHGKD